MSDYAGVIDTQQKQKSSPLEKYIKVGALIFAFLVAAELVWLLVISPFMPFSTISLNVSGASLPSSRKILPGLGKAELLVQAGITPSSSYMTANVIDIQSRLEELYQVEDAQVTKRYPDTLSIVLSPRKPSVETLLSISGKATPVYLDAAGMVVRIGDEGLPLDAGRSYPLVTGINVKQIYLGCRLPARYQALFTRIAYLEQASPEYLAMLSEIAINEKEYGGFDLTLYPVYYSARFLVKSDLSDADLKAMALYMDVFKKTGIDAEVVDLRSGAASYIERTKGGGNDK
jgi:cell division protein FtsQ